MKRFTSALIILSILSTPALAAPSAPKEFKSMAVKSKTTDDYKYAYVNLNWWDNFNDDILNGYIEKAILNNYDLKMATINVDEYYQNVKLQFSNELPSLNIGLSPAYARMPAMLGMDAGTGWSFIAPAMASYELDLFLKNHDKTKAVKKLHEASKFDERAAYISVASAVGTTYLNIVKLDKIINLQEEIVSSRKTISDLTILRNNEGIASTADTVRANKAYAAGMSDLMELKKQREKLLNQLAVLIGESPENSDQLARTDFDKISYTAKIPETIPSEVITQRPDYLKAEIMVEKAGIDVRVAKKEFLPSLSLTGLALFNAPKFGSLLTTSNAIAAIAGSAMLPLFTGGARVATLKLKKDEYERILQNYYKTNLTAIQEVNDAMSAIRLDEEKLNLTTKQANMEAKDYKFNQARYDQGVISKLDLIQFKENLLMMDKLLANQKAECLVNYIGLYKATGTKI